MSAIFRSSANGLQAQQLRLDIVADNIANASTPGFRAARADLVSLSRAPLEVAEATGIDGEPVEVGQGVALAGVSRSFTQGALQLTDQPLDLAILGNDAWFQVVAPDGSTAYTRAGAFSIDGQGRLVAGNGDLVSPAISVPPGTTISYVSGDGVLHGVKPGGTTDEPLGQLLLARFPNPDGLAAVGTDRFVATPAAGTPLTGAPGTNGLPQVGGGVLEASNVDLTEQMTTMMEAQRAYTMNLRVVQALDEMIGGAIQTRT